MIYITLAIAAILAFTAYCICATDKKDPQEDIEQAAYLEQWNAEHRKDL